MRLKILGAAAAALALVVPVVALAASGDVNVTLAKGQTHTGTYYAAGQTVSVDGDVNGDVVCAAQTVTINGAVNGDVLCAGQTVTVNGPVTGSVRVAGQTVNVNSTVGRNVTAAGQIVQLGSASHVTGEVALAGQNVTLDGPVDHAANLAAENVTMNSTVGGDVNAALATLSMGSGATVAGSFTYTSNEPASIDKSKVQGDVTFHKSEKKVVPKQTPAELWLQMLLFWIVAITGATLLAVWVLPRLVRSVTDAMLRKAQASFGWGALGLIVIPVVLFALMLTVLGIPLGVWLLVAWVLLLTATAPFAGLALGQLILGRKTPDMKFMLQSALVGVPILVIVLNVPWLGPLVGLVATVWVQGGILLALNRTRALG
jgi:cytoskeletal protein CcmA (bactofilin family)